MNYAQDEIVYPADAEGWAAARPGQCEMHSIPGVGHYPQRVPGAVEGLADLLQAWAG